MSDENEVKTYWSSWEVAEMAEEVAVERNLSPRGVTFSSYQSNPGIARRTVKEALALLMAIPEPDTYRSAR